MLLPTIAVAAEGAAPDAWTLLRTGHYAEAAERFSQRIEAKDAPPRAALGLAQALAAQGKYDEAATALQAARKRHPKDAGPPAALAEMAFERGDCDEARKLADEALKLDENQLAARWIEAELLRVSGDLDGANEAYEWFVDYYNSQDEIEDPAALRYIGLAAAQFARWNRLSDQFSFLVNELYPAALELDKNYWPAHYESGRLFLEKYNEAEATRSLQAALAINPNAADARAALAELQITNFKLDAALRSIRAARAVNPKHLGARLMLADLHFANLVPDLALDVLEKARKLNPVSEPLLGRLAAAYGMVDGMRDAGPESRLGKLEAEVLNRNPHCGAFYYALAESLDKSRKYPAAARYYRKALDAMPQLVGARGQLALMHMRLGAEEKAKPLLKKSFEIDPFNVRVKNTLAVLEVLDGYETLETEHFILRFDGKKDRLLVRYAARRLEEIYPAVCERMGYEPPEKTLFEIFNQAKNTDGHGWFSARMVGLPAIHTIGACAGKMVALTSPSALEGQRFNWARVLKHEFVHVVNLQQTHFNVPHWFTEGLAVLLEDSPRSAEWNAMLARRVPAGKTFDLDSINLAFVRPATSEDWQMAYCQAEFYAQYMLAAHGPDALGKMLTCYRDNLNTREALERAFGVAQEDFEKGYKEYVAKIVAKLHGAAEPAAAKSLSELRKAHAAKPDDVEAAAALALAYLQRQLYPDAGKLADRVLAAEPKHQLASYVKAKLLLVIGEREAALKKLEAALDREQPQTDLLKLLAGMKYKAGALDEAAKLYELGRRREPFDPDWVKSLAVVRLKTGDKVKLQPLLEELAERDRANLAIRKKLAQMALLEKDYPAAAKWANQCLNIDVLDNIAHRVLAQALAYQKKWDGAVEEYQVAIELAPKNSRLRLALAEVFRAANRPAEARTTLEALLKLNPNLPAAKAMLEELGP